MQLYSPQQIETLLKSYSPLLGRVAASYEANPHLQQELLQEISLAVWQALARFNQQSSIKTYILKVAHNRAVTHVAKQCRQISAEPYCEVAPTSPLPGNTLPAEQQIQLETLLTHIQALPLQTRQVLTLSMEGMNYQEIADICGLKSSHVGAILSRSKKQLKELFDEQ